jgi:endonuclease/exonuclease/phosphatase (EEP) superfamily protein YafD
LKSARLVFAAVVLLTGAGLLGSLNKYLELASHFRVQYLLAAAACLPVFVYTRARLTAALASVYVLAVAALLLPWYVRPAPPKDDAGQVRAFKLLLFNVNYGNTRHAEVVRFVEAERPDVVVLQEVNAAWLRGIEGLAATYPHAVAQAQEGDGSGLALLGRAPFEEARVVYVGSEDRPGIRARFKVGGSVVSLLTLHPRAPLRPGHFEARNRQLLAGAEFVRALPEPKIFVGDFNATPWSPYFKRIEAETGLADARKGFGLLPTWPVWNRVAPLMLPVDHCLVSRDVTVLGVERGPALGSDHLPLVVRLAVRGE